MAILDTFYMLFKTNSDDVRKGMQNAEKATGDFTNAVNRSGAEISSAGSHIAHVFENVAIRIASAFAIERVLEFTHAQIEANAALEQTSERIGVAVEDLSALQGAATRFGGSADGVTASLDFLNRGMADIAVKGTSRLKPFFDELKINPVDAAGKVKPLLEVYGELADRLGKMTAQERAGYGEKFGIDQGLLMTLASGRRGFEDIIQRQKDLGITTAQDAEAAEKFEQKMADLTTVFHHFANEIIGTLLPVLENIVDGFMEIVTFLEHHASLVKGFFIGVAGVITAIYGPAILEAVAATAVWLAEVLLIPAIIVAVAAAFAFLYDDIQNFLEGNKSVIGELSKRWPELGEVVKKTAKVASDAWQSFVETVKDSKNLIVATLDLISAAWENHAKSVSSSQQKIIADSNKNYPLMAAWVTNFNKELASLEKTIENFAKLLGLDIFKWFFGAVADIPAAVSNYTKQIQNETAVERGTKTQAQVDAEEKSALEARIKKRFGPSAPAPTSRAASDKPTSPTHVPISKPAPGLVTKAVQTVQQHILAVGQQHLAIATATRFGAIGGGTTNHSIAMKTITVNVASGAVVIQTPATDPKEIQGAVSDHLSDHIRKAINAHDDGVAR